MACLTSLSVSESGKVWQQGLSCLPHTGNSFRTAREVGNAEVVRQVQRLEAELRIELDSMNLRIMRLEEDVKAGKRHLREAVEEMGQIGLLTKRSLDDHFRRFERLLLGIPSPSDRGPRDDAPKMDGVL